MDENKERGYVHKKGIGGEEPGGKIVLMEVRSA